MKVLLPILLYSLTISARADVATVAVASNFVPVFERIVKRFETETTHEIRMVAGASGKLYAQILRGAPFDLFLSADHAKPKALVDSGHAQTASLITYAIGQLSLWSNVDRAAEWKNRSVRELIVNGHFERLAIANPTIAPYGLASQQVLASLGVYKNQQASLIVGENVSQVFHFLHSKNAELGFVSRSQVMSLGNQQQGTAWSVPNELHTAIRQDMVLLVQSDSVAAATLHSYLQTNEVRTMIVGAGYSEFAQ